MGNIIEHKKTYFPCKVCKGYSLMFFNGYEFQCRKGHIENIADHLKSCTNEDLCSIIKELLQKNHYIQERIQAYNNGLINIKDLLKAIERI